MSRKRTNYMNERVKEGFFKQSKKEDVRARSFYKLEQLDKKFKLFSNVNTVLDLGCAPGGWCEYVSKNYTNVKIIGVDLLPIRRRHEFGKNVTFIEDDFNNLKEYVQDQQFDLIISDIAPEFSGDSQIDRGRTHKANNETIELSKEFLQKGGNLIFKTFEGTGLDDVRRNAKIQFREIKEFKPQSSQLKSSETFLVCLGRK